MRLTATRLARTSIGGSGDRLYMLAGQSAVLDLDFTTGSIVDRVAGYTPTFTRAGAVKLAWSGSQFASYAADVPAFQLASDGVLEYLHEPAATNLYLNSGTPATQSITVTAQQYTLSFYGTGTLTLSGASTAGPLVGTGAEPNRVSLTFTPSAGSLTLTLSGSISRPQLETGAVATSPITTTGSTATRTADAMSLTGSNFSGWFPSDGQVSVYIEYTPPPASSSNQFVWAIDNSATGPGVDEVRYFVNSGNIRSPAISSSNITTFAPTAGAVVSGQLEKCILAAGPNNSTFAGNRFTRPATDTTVTLPIGPDRLAIGRRSNNTFPSLPLGIRRFTVFRGRLPDSILDAMVA